MTIHDGARIELRVMVVGQRDRRQRFLVDTVIMHEAARSQCDPLRGNIEPVGRGVGRGTRDRVTYRGLAETAELALGEGAEDDAVFRVTGVDRGGRVADRARSTPTTAPPDH